MEDFVRILGEINTVKPPGVSGSRIKALKEIFMAENASQTELTDKLLTGCRNTVDSNKLGALYVLDALVRAAVDSQSPSGGEIVAKCERDIASLLDEALSTASDDVRDKLSKLVDIWAQCNTFSPETIAAIRNKHFKSHTPPGSPPAKAAAPAATKPVSNSVLSALANLAQKKSPQPSPAETESNPNAIFQLLQTMNKNSPQQSNANSSTSNHNNHNNHNNNSSTNSSNYRDRNEARAGNTSHDNNRRDRSPTRGGGSNASAMENGEQNVPSNPHFRPKRPYIDAEIPQGSIGVLSRTIFIGGVPNSMGKPELADTLRPYAEVQSVILNSERKHAFVKVYSRAEAEQVIQALGNNHPSGLRARWGVGYGPRDCCNYQTGISTIPIHRLTDADKKWINCAQWGGTVPELPLQTGLFVEEPDIEVGSGVSSKSVSRKMPTNNGNPHGPRSDNQRGNRGHNSHGNHHQQQQQPPYQQQQQPYYQNSPQQQQQPPIVGYGMPPQQPPMGMPGYYPPPQQQQPPPMPAMNQAQMMAMMQQMMQQQQGGNNGANVDMAAMFQTMQNMMQQQQQQPPR